MPAQNQSLFTNKSFVLLMIGQIVSLLGSIIQRFALSLYVLGLTGSGTMFASVLAVSLVPTILLGPVAGVVADRFNRRNIMIVLDILSAIVGGIMVVMAMNGQLGLPAIYVSVILLAIFTTFYEPAVQASIPSIVKGLDDGEAGDKEDDNKILQANSVNSIVMTLANLVGPVIAGMLYSGMGLEAILIINAVSFLAAAFLEMFMVIPQAIREKTGSMIEDFTADIKEGYFYLKNDKYLSKLIVATLVSNIFIAPIFTVGVAYVTKITLGSTDQMYGISEGVIMAGSLLAPIIVAVFTKKLDVKNAFFFSVLLSGVFLISAGGSVWPAFTQMFADNSVPFWIFTGSGFMIMAVITTFNIVGVTMLQNDTPNEMLGRVMALVTSLIISAIPLGQMMFGVLFDQFSESSHIPLLFAAVVTMALAIYIRIALAGYQSKERTDAKAEPTTDASAS